jgi:uncharacterized membrane protein YidH (DUF202 family)
MRWQLVGYTCIALAACLALVEFAVFSNRHGKLAVDGFLVLVAIGFAASLWGEHKRQRTEQRLNDQSPLNEGHNLSLIFALTFAVMFIAFLLSR